MKNKTILILGGYGGTGRSLAYLLLKETTVNIVIAGRNESKAKSIADKLNLEFKDRVRSVYADTSNVTSLENSFRKIDLVLFVTTSPQDVLNVAKTALKLNIDYLDVLFEQSTVEKLKQIEDEIKKKKRTFITQAGFHPGLPAVLVRFAAKYFDNYDKAIIGMAMNAKFEKPESTIDLINAARDFDAVVCKEGKWRKANFKDIVTIDFGSRFGKRQCYPLKMEEMIKLPSIYGLKETGVYVAGFNFIVDKIIFPLIFISHKIKKNSGTKLFQKLIYFGVNKLVSKEKGVVMVLEAQGKEKNKPLNLKLILEHEDGYIFTAAPIVACLKQYLKNKLPIGLGMMGQIVDEKRLFKDMENMGIKISIGKIEKF